MKKLLFILMCFFPIVLFSQEKMNIRQVWIGENLEYLDLTSETVLFDYGHGIYKYNLEIKDSVIELFTKGSDQYTGNPKQCSIFYKIITSKEDTIILKPLDKQSNNLLRNSSTIYSSSNFKNYTFVKKEALYTDSISFERIYFSSTQCLGKCPTMETEIDKFGNVSFKGIANTKRFKGNYKGKLKAKELARLKEILKKSELDRIPSNLGSAIDAPDYKFIINYNNKIRKIKGYYLPYFNQELLSFFLNIYKKSSLKKCQEIEITLPNTLE